ncbi:prolyl 3-hydroxylase 1-like [Glandiceps talaboti]
MAQMYTVLCLFAMTFISVMLMSNGQYSTTYDELYNSAIQSYTAEDWDGCIENMEMALSEFKFYRTSLVNCRLRCNNISTTFDSESDLLEDIDLPFFARILKKAECLKNCKGEVLGLRPERISDEVTSEFVKRTPYSYLQMAYYKTDQPKKAATAAYTFLLANPEDEMMLSNMQFYQDQYGIDQMTLSDLEIKPYQDLSLKGVSAYASEDWPESIVQFEASLADYYKEYNECAALCEGPYEYEEFQDLHLSIATHYHSVLTCQLGCEDRLSLIDGRLITDFLAQSYHHLQFAYYTAEEKNKAAEAAVTYLLFLPGDEVMAKNVMFYEKQDDIDVDSFKPRKEAVKHYAKLALQKEMKKFIEDSIFTDEDQGKQIIDTEVPPVPPSGKQTFQKKRKGESGDLSEVMNDEIEDGEELEVEHGKAKYLDEALYKRSVDNDGSKSTDNDDDDDDEKEEDRIRVIMTEKELNGTLRMAADGFATEEQCQELMELVASGATEGDGYQGRPKPHTKHERFVGLTVLKAAEEAEAGRVEAKAALSYLDLSEKTRKYVEQYFKLPSRLYFSYTHLVCRTAEPGSPKDRDDLSHPVHADNCYLDEIGNCIKELPAYTWRDYSAIMYLNDDFQGGEFIFAKFNHTVEASVQPKCGRMVSFSAGKENLHGVKAVLEGRRCALAIWFTMDVKYDEREHLKARSILNGILGDEP